MRRSISRVTEQGNYYLVEKKQFYRLGIFTAFYSGFQGSCEGNIKFQSIRL